MAFDFTKQPPWVKTDPGPYYTITATRITATNLPRNVNANFYRNLGLTLSGDFQFKFSLKMTAVASTMGIYPIIMLDNTFTQAPQNYLSMIGFDNTANGAIYLQEIVGGYLMQSVNTAVLTNNTEYWYTYQRTGALLECLIYNDATRLSLKVGLSLTLKYVRNYPYVYIESSYNDGTASTSGTSYVDTLTLTGFSELIASAVENGTATERITPPNGTWNETMPIFSAPSAVTITLDNLANLATATSNAIDNSTTLYDEIELEILSTYNGTKTEPCFLDIKILKSIDGTNYGTVDSCNLTLPALNFVNAAAQRYTARFKAPRWWKLVVINHTGGFLQNGGGGNAVSFIGINPVFVI